MTISTGPTPSLPDIDVVAPLSPTDQPLMDELYQVLRRHNALGRVGITLLHEHFDLDDDEIMVESTDKPTRTQTIAPMKVSEVGNLDAIETSWRLDTGGPVMACICVRFSPKEHQHHSRG